MATALNQTPADGAVTVWTLLQTMLHPVAASPYYVRPAFVGAANCGCGGGCASCCAPCDPCSTGCGGIMPPNIQGDPCSAWSVASSGTGPGGTMTLCGLLQQSAADLAIEGNWLVVQSPGYMTSPAQTNTQYRRQFSFQRGPTNALWRIKYSARAGFTTAPAPGVTPSAADEVPILGGGTDAAPTFGTLLPADGSYRLQINVFQAGGLPGLYLVTYPLGDPTPNACLMLDPLAPGSYPTDSAGFSLEQDPVVIYQATGANTLRAITLSSESAGFTGWINYTLPSQVYTRVPAAFFGTYTALGAARVVMPAGLAQTAIADSIDTGRTFYARPAALGGTTGRIGDVNLWRWNGQALGGGQLISQQTQAGSEPYYWLTMGDVLLRWDSHTSTVVI